MGLSSPRIYLDACIIIYVVEEHERFGETARHAVERIGLGQFCVSPLVELECLVGPLRQDHHRLLGRYEDFFRQQVMLAMDAPAFRLAADLRARHRLKTPDALHLSAAQHHGCAELWTNDDRLAQAAGSMAVNVLVGIR